MTLKRRPYPRGPDGFPTQLPPAMAFLGAEGGVGVSVTVLRMAALAELGDRSGMLVDVTGDLAVTLGLPTHLRGITDVASDGPTATSVSACVLRLTDHVSLLPVGTAGIDGLDGIDAAPRAELWEAVNELDMSTWIDAGRGVAALERLRGIESARIVLTRPTRSGIERTRQLLQYGVDLVMCAEADRDLVRAADLEAALGTRVDPLRWTCRIADDADRHRLLGTDRLSQPRRPQRRGDDAGTAQEADAVEMFSVAD